MSLKSPPFRALAAKLAPRRRRRFPPAASLKLIALAGGGLVAIVVATVVARRGAPSAASAGTVAPGADSEAAKLDVDAPNEGATGSNPSPTDS